jgi:hypothetical protein
MVDKELLYDKCEQVLDLLETLRDIEIDDDYYQKPLQEMDENLDITIDWLNHMIDNEIVGPK